MKVSYKVVMVSIVLATVTIAVTTNAFQKRFAIPGPPTKAEVDRGRYLVEEIAKCPECHTPRKPDGELEPGAWLRGAPIWIKPVAPIQNWADSAPALAGLPSFTEAQAEKVLEDGTGPNGEALRPPMHIYHMAPADARAIVAYLKSLPAEVHLIR
jgi:mono/diheme cytochrome c family protein